jgi:hypothetical protein
MLDAQFQNYSGHSPKEKSGYGYAVNKLPAKLRITVSEIPCGELLLRFIILSFKMTEYSETLY